jgi:hypothetical protein
MTYSHGFVTQVLQQYEEGETLVKSTADSSIYTSGGRLFATSTQLIDSDSLSRILHEYVIQTMLLTGELDVCL